MAVLLFKRILVLLILFNFSFPPNVFAVSGSEALLGIAVNYYTLGYYREALCEFNKVLLIEPNNEEAKIYILRIREKQAQTRSDTISHALDNFDNSNPPVRKFSRQEIINQELDKRLGIFKPAVDATKQKSGDYLDIKGEARASLGVRPSAEVVWKEANGDLNEKNYRVLFGEGRYDTYDPAIFDRLRLKFDTKNLDELGIYNINAHADITVDPWSFTGKSDKFTITGSGGDSVELQLKYWSNTARTINETVFTNINGDAMSLPEIKVISGMTSPTSVTSTFLNNFSIPSKKIDMNFIPVREFWFDFKDEEHLLRIFPIAYQDQALTTDDPLRLSNNHTWWEESPWLADWRQGNLNIGATPVDFRKGAWDDSLAFFTRDSDGLRLTALRGAAFSYDGVDMKLKSTVASPKNLWAD